MKKTTSCIALAVILLALAAGGVALAPAPAGAQAKPVVWNLPSVAAPTYFHSSSWSPTWRSGCRGT